MRLTLAVLMVVCLASSVLADSEAESPEGCWTMRDGCPARTGACATQGLSGELATAWVYPVQKRDGEVEEEPRVWGDRVFVALRVASQRRALHVLSLADGQRVVATKTFKTDLPLDVSVSKKRILVRADRKHLALFTCYQGRFVQLRRFRNASGFAGGLLSDGHVYAVASDALQCWDAGTGALKWKVEGTFRGRPTLRGQDVYAIEYESGDAFLRYADRLHGGGGKVYVGTHRTRTTPALGADISIVALEKGVFVHHDTVVETKDGSLWPCAWLSRTSRPRLTSRIEGHSLVGFERPVLAVGDGWVTVMRGKKDSDRQMVRFFRTEDGSYDWGLLASEQIHPEFLSSDVPLTRAGTAVFAGGRGFDLTDYRICVETDQRSRCRAVPAHETLLVVDGAGRLRARREADAVAVAPVFLASLRSKDPPVPPVARDLVGSLLLADGTMHRGAFRLDAERTTFTLAGKEEADVRPLSLVRLAVDPNGVPLYVRALRDLSGDLGSLLAAENLTQWLALCKEAQGANDPSLLARLMAEAEARGAASAQLATTRRRLDGWAKRGPIPKPIKIRAVEEKAKSLRAKETTALVRVLAQSLEGEPWEVKSRILAELLRLAPDNPRASNVVRAAIPECVPRGDPFRPADWLGVLGGMRGLDLTLVDPPLEGARELTTQEREVGAARHFWRKDLLGLQTEQVLLVSPFEHPPASLEVLQQAELVLNALESLFREAKHVRDERDPLYIQLFESAEHYKNVSLKGVPSLSLAARMAEIPGYFAEEDCLTRIHVPEEGVEPGVTMRALSYELTLHWLKERCPSVTVQEYRNYHSSPGYWVRAGLAGMLADFDWRHEARTWRTLDRRASSLDLIANAGPKQLLPWEFVLMASSGEVAGLPREPVLPVPVRWRVGMVSVADPMILYYDQAAVMWSYLYHAGGRSRYAVLAAVRELHTGALYHDKGKYVERLFGHSAEVLGARAVAWARDVLAGNVKIEDGR